MTWDALLREGRLKLSPAFADESAEEVMREARFLLSWASGFSSAWLSAHGGEEAPHLLVERYGTALSRRANREPFAYITGQAGFCGHLFEVTPAVLIPRPDTELLVEIVSSFFHERAANPEMLETPDIGGNRAGHFQGPRMLEIGTGSGCISCILALKHEKLHTAALDISGEALAVARRNAARLGVSGRIRFFQADVLSVDLSAVLPDDQPAGSPSFPTKSVSAGTEIRYDAIVSNPPYIASADLAGLMPDIARYEPQVALDGGADGLLFYRRLLRISKGLLKKDGLLAVEIGYNQAIAVPDLFREEAFVPTVHFDLGGNPRVVTARTAR